MTNVTLTHGAFGALLHALHDLALFKVRLPSSGGRRRVHQRHHRNTSSEALDAQVLWRRRGLQANAASAIGSEPDPLTPAYFKTARQTADTQHCLTEVGPRRSAQFFACKSGRRLTGLSGTSRRAQERYDNGRRSSRGTTCSDPGAPPRLARRKRLDRQGVDIGLHHLAHRGIDRAVPGQ